MMIHRSYFYYVEKKDDYEVSVAIKDASEFGDGFWKIFARIRRSGKNWNHKKVYRVYKSMCYNKRSKLKKDYLQELRIHWCHLNDRIIHGQWILSVTHWKVVANSGY